MICHHYLPPKGDMDEGYCTLCYERIEIKPSRFYWLWILLALVFGVTA